MVFTAGSLLALNIPIGAEDTLTFSAATASGRYPRLPDANFDSVTLVAKYRYIIGGFHPLPGAVFDDTRVVDALDFAVTESTSFEPTFQRATVSFLTPSVTVGRRNIPLSNELCGEKKNAFCYFGEIVGNIGHSFSDVPTAENTNGYASAAVGVRMFDNKLALSLGARIAGRHYTNFPGSRDDLTLSVGPGLSWTPNSNVTASIGVTYFEQYSTIERARWNGFVVTSGVSARFSVLP